MKTNYLDQFFGLSLEQVSNLLVDFSDKRKKDVEDEMEYYLLCYPQGTGDDELEETLEVLAEYFYPDD
jgi:hypothetical protein